MARQYLVVLEQGDTTWGAYVPDLPGCTAVGDTEEEVLRLITEAIDFHLEALAEAGQEIPPPRNQVRMVEVAG